MVDKYIDTYIYIKLFLLFQFICLPCPKKLNYVVKTFRKFHPCAIVVWYLVNKTRWSFELKEKTFRKLDFLTCHMPEHSLFSCSSHEGPQYSYNMKIHIYPIFHVEQQNVQSIIP